MISTLHINRYIFLICLISAISPTLAQTPQLKENFYETDGPVYAIEVDDANEKIYIGGNFTYAGPTEPHGAVIDKNIGLVNFAFDNPNNTVYSSVSDGNGGWYIGGAFTETGGQIRKHLAHLLPNGEVSGWSPELDGNVYAMVLREEILYLTGGFTQVNGENRLGLAAFDITTGSLTDWNPMINGLGYTLDISGNTIYLGGEFTDCGKFGRYGTTISVTDESINLASGVPNGPVLASIPDGQGGWYIGGSFTKIGSEDRIRIAHIDSAGQLSAWNPDVNSHVHSLLLRDSILYVGGQFTQVNGIDRYRIAAINVETGELTKFNARLNSTVRAISEKDGILYVGGAFSKTGGGKYGVPLSLENATTDINFSNPNSTVHTCVADGVGGWYIGGEFTIINGQPRNRLAHLDANGDITDWNPGADNTVRALLLDQNVLYVGGEFSNIGGLSRSAIAAIDATSGTVTSWNPNSNGTILSMAKVGSNLWIGGAFSQIGGLTRNRIASLNLLSGQPTSWAPQANGQVKCIVSADGKVYVGGDFTSIGGLTRNKIASFDAESGLLSDWNPNANQGGVRNIAVAGDTIYVCGTFQSIGGQNRKNIASLHATTGLATTWNPIVTSAVNRVVVNGNTVYIGGHFANVNNTARFKTAAIQSNTGDLTPWAPIGEDISQTTTVVLELVLQGDKIYVGGDFTFLGAVDRRSLAGFHTSTSNLTEWNPDANDWVYDLIASNDGIFAAGSFTQIGGLSRKGIAKLDLMTGLAISNWNSNAAGPDPYLYPNPIIYSMSFSDSTLYVGGSFSSIGNQSRINIAEILVETGLPTSWDANSSSFNTNTIHKVAHNGNLLFVSGSLSILSDYFIRALNTNTGEITSWSPNINGFVNAFAFQGNSMYVAGGFTALGGVRRSNLASFQRIGGNVNAWNPKAYQRVNSVVVGENSVYVGGDFMNIDGIPRRYLAEINKNTAQLTSWNPDPNDAVLDIELANGKVYIAGKFQQVGNLYRFYVAELNPITGAASNWKPRPDGYVNTLQIENDIVYMGGEFTKFLDSDELYPSAAIKARRYIAAVSLNSGFPTLWSPTASAPVRALSLDENNVYAGGDFKSIGGAPRNRLAAFNSTTGELLPSIGSLPGALNSPSSSRVYTLAVRDSILYVGGLFTQINGQPRNHLAALNLNTGELTAFNPNPGSSQSGQIRALQLSDDGNIVYAGGYFSSIGGQLRSRLAALNSITGQATAWNANISSQQLNYYIESLKLHENLLYVGGLFTSAGGQMRNNIAAIDVETAIATSWTPDANAKVTTISISEPNILLGGDFTSIGGMPRNYVAAVNLNTGIPNSWNPSIVRYNEYFNPVIKSIQVAGDQVYIGGTFDEVGGALRPNLASVHLDSGEISTWNPIVPIVYAGAITENTLFFGSDFSESPEIPKRGLLAYDISGCEITTFPGSTCFIEGVEGTYDENCNCIENPVQQSCVDFLSNYNNQGGSDIYRIALNDSLLEADLQHIFSTPHRVSVAMNTDNGRLFLAHESGNAFQTINPLATPVTAGPIVTFPNSIGTVTGAAYAGNGEYFISADEPKAVWRITQPPFSPSYHSFAQVSGGDMVVSPQGDVLLASKNPRRVFKIIEGGANEIVAFLPENVSGIARMFNDNYLLLAEGSSQLILGDANGNDTGVRYNLRLNGNTFVPMNGDLASGCGVIPAGISNESFEEPVAESAGILYSIPNPTEGISTVVYRPTANTRALLELYDIRGVLIATIFNRDVEADQTYSSQFDASHLPNGVYFYRLTTPNQVAVEKLLIAR